jgi:NAD dependent epimerase/dehydratase family enzyme
MVMSYDKDSIFDYLLWLVRMGLGGTAGHGKQYISWVHYIDFINSLEFIINNDKIEGPINIASPNPLPNKEFMKILRQSWGQKIGLPAFEWMLELGAIFLKTETELILKSRRVIPTRLLNEGFVFSFPDWKEASKDLCQKWKESNKPKNGKNT